MSTQQEPIRLKITAKDDPKSGWVGCISSDSCKEFKRVGILDLNDGGHVSMYSFAAHIATHLKRHYRGRTFVIEDCEVENKDDCGILPNLIMMYLNAIDV